MMGKSGKKLKSMGKQEKKVYLQFVNENCFWDEKILKTFFFIVGKLSFLFMGKWLQWKFTCCKIKENLQIKIKAQKKNFFCQQFLSTFPGNPSF